MNKPHRKLINASLGSSNVRYWLGAVKLTDLKVCYEPDVDITSKSIMDDSRLGKPVSWPAMLNCLFPRVVCNFY